MPNNIIENLSAWFLALSANAVFFFRRTMFTLCPCNSAIWFSNCPSKFAHISVCASTIIIQVWRVYGVHYNYGEYASVNGFMIWSALSADLLLIRALGLKLCETKIKIRDLPKKMHLEILFCQMEITLVSFSWNSTRNWTWQSVRSEFAKKKIGIVT